MPLTLAEKGEENVIRKIGGKQDVKVHLENLGFVVGGAVTVVSAIGGNVIVDVQIRKVAPLGDPIEVTVRGYELSIRKADAETIEVD